MLPPRHGRDARHRASGFIASELRSNMHPRPGAARSPQHHKSVRATRAEPRFARIWSRTAIDRVPPWPDGEPGTHRPERGGARSGRYGNVSCYPVAQTAAERSGRTLTQPPGAGGRNFFSRERYVLCLGGGGGSHLARHGLGSIHPPPLFVEAGGCARAVRTVGASCVGSGTSPAQWARGTDVTRSCNWTADSQSAVGRETVSLATC